jgi:AhpD family alkylhydroperoxidase
MSDVRVRYEDFAKRMPAVHAALLMLSKSAGQAGLDKTLIELIEIRASQINGCAFCLAYHLNSARQVPVPAAKLDDLARGGHFQRTRTSGARLDGDDDAARPGVGLRCRLCSAAHRVQRG